MEMIPLLIGQKPQHIAKAEETLEFDDLSWWKIQISFSRKKKHAAKNIEQD